MSLINEASARSMVRLLGETAAIQGGHAEKKQFLMNGLCRLIHADTRVWTLSCQNTPGAPQVYVGFLHGGFTEKRYSQFLAALEHPEMGKVTQPFFEAIHKNNGVCTMQRSEIDPEGKVYHSDAGKKWDAADIGPLIMSCHALDEQSASGIGIYRRANEADFTKAEVQMAHIILTEVPWLHQAGWPEDRGVSVPQLSPRQRTVLNLLLDGWSRKQIAGHLEISQNTVSGYAKEIYKHFGVNSHPELMKRFINIQS